MINEGVCLQMKNHHENINKYNDILKGNLSIAAGIESVSDEQEKDILNNLTC